MPLLTGTPISRQGGETPYMIGVPMYQILTATAIFFCTCSGAIAGEEKLTAISSELYFELTRELGHIQTHLKYTIFQTEVIEVPIYSKKRGNTTLLFHPQMFIPAWTDRDQNSKVSVDEITLLPTMSIVDHVRLSMNGSNNLHDESTMKAVRISARSASVVTQEKLDLMHHDEQLIEEHGIRLFEPRVTSDGRSSIGPGEEMRAILKAVKDQLQRQIEAKQ